MDVLILTWTFLPFLEKTWNGRIRNGNSVLNHRPSISGFMATPYEQLVRERWRHHQSITHGKHFELHQLHGAKKSSIETNAANAWKFHTGSLLKTGGPVTTLRDLRTLGSCMKITFYHKLIVLFLLDIWQAWQHGDRCWTLIQLDPQHPSPAFRKEIDFGFRCLATNNWLNISQKFRLYPWMDPGIIWYLRSLSSLSAWSTLYPMPFESFKQFPAPWLVAPYDMVGRGSWVGSWVDGRSLKADTKDSLFPRVGVAGVVWQRWGEFCGVFHGAKQYVFAKLMIFCWSFLKRHRILFQISCFQKHVQFQTCWAILWLKPKMIHDQFFVFRVAFSERQKWSWSWAFPGAIAHWLLGYA